MLRIRKTPGLMMGGLLLATPGVSWADAGVPMIFVTFPMMLIGLVPIILIEAFVLYRHLRCEKKNALKVSAVANVVSTLIGIPFTWVVLAGAQIATAGGGAWGINTIWGKFLAVTWQAPWLIPYETDLFWMLPVASLILLIPFFFVSWWLEFLTADKYLYSLEKNVIGSAKIKAAVFSANLYSYLLLAAVDIVWLVIEICRHA